MSEENTLYEQYYEAHPYYALLRDISARTIAVQNQKNLLSMNLFKIDLDARQIIAPPDYLDFIVSTKLKRSPSNAIDTMKM